MASDPTGQAKNEPCGRLKEIITIRRSQKIPDRQGVTAHKRTRPKSLATHSRGFFTASKHRGCGGILPILEKFARSRRREPAFHSSSFFSRSCALFCTQQNSTLFLSINSALFAQKHRGWELPSLLSSATSAILEGQMIARPQLLAQNITQKRIPTP